MAERAVDVFQLAGQTARIVEPVVAGFESEADEFGEKRIAGGAFGELFDIAVWDAVFADVVVKQRSDVLRSQPFEVAGIALFAVERVIDKCFDAAVRAGGVDQLDATGDMAGPAFQKAALFRRFVESVDEEDDALAGAQTGGGFFQPLAEQAEVVGEGRAIGLDAGLEAPLDAIREVAQEVFDGGGLALPAPDEEFEHMVGEGFAVVVFVAFASAQVGGPAQDLQGAGEKRAFPAPGGPQ